MNLRTPADIALLVKERRKQLGVSQHQLADRIGGSRQWVQKLEQGLPGLELGLTLRALHALGVMLDATNGPQQLTVAGSEFIRGGQGLSIAAADKSVPTRSDIVAEREPARQEPSAAPRMVFVDIDSIVDANRSRDVVGAAQVGNTASATTQRR